MPEPILVDARHCEPPLPMDMALNAAGRLKKGQFVRMLLHREPFPLYELLLGMGLEYRTRITQDGDYEIVFGSATDLPC